MAAKPNNRLDHELLESMYDRGVRVAAIIHVRAATTDTESPADPLASFIDDDCEDSAVLQQFAPVWPEYAACIRDFAQIRAEEEEEEDDRRGAAETFRGEVAYLFATRCPRVFLVSVEYQIASCVEANPEREGLGTWRCGWGYYGSLWLLVDDIAEAAAQGVAIAKEHQRVEWQKAIDEGRVQKKRGARR